MDNVKCQPIGKSDAECSTIQDHRLSIYMHPILIQNILCIDPRYRIIDLKRRYEESEKKENYKINWG